MMITEAANITQAIKCACRSCQCPVVPDKAVERDGQLYCSRACAYDCTETTCVCIHDRCDGSDHAHASH